MNEFTATDFIFFGVCLWVSGFIAGFASSMLLSRLETAHSKTHTASVATPEAIGATQGSRFCSSPSPINQERGGNSQ